MAVHSELAELHQEANHAFADAAEIESGNEHLATAKDHARKTEHHWSQAKEERRQQTPRARQLMIAHANSAESHEKACHDSVHEATTAFDRNDIAGDNVDESY